ncbi:MAG: type II toxin-antitoxin system YafQ family toxin [Muribaculaceae bacterium]
MKHLRFTTKFKKDLKRYERQTAKIGKLLKLLSFLKNDLPIPAIYKAHTLKGEYAGCMECHIEGDFLLIWFDEDNDIIALVRLGSHSELFGNGANK